VLPRLRKPEPLQIVYVSNELTVGQEAPTRAGHDGAEPEMSESVPEALGVVVIGRNEGERLQRCLDSLRELMPVTVYVDSGSIDDSVAASRARGASIVELDPKMPFTAARARNEGFRRLLELHPALQYVFFVDGDCEVAAGWVTTAVRFLGERPETAVVWGWRRERYPERSIYNLLTDLEWSSFALGETTGCGGDAVMRVDAFRQASGFRSGLICGEEPELCVRLRKAGWRIWHIDTAMTLHDAALYRFSQWWKRMTRGGYAYALGAHLHGKPPVRHWVGESRRAWLWGLWLPLVVLAGALLLGPWALLALVVYPLQMVRLAAGTRGPAAHRWLRAGALVLSKFPEVLGQIKFLWDRLRGVETIIIEYK
jgi:GT2 family glycosyltransferase